jgi:hypothetical protein
MNSLKMNIDDLSESSIEYEILIRGAKPYGDLTKKKQFLRSIVRNEDPSITLTSCFDPEEDIKACFLEFNHLKGELPREGAKLTKYETSKLCSKAIHLRERLKRIQSSNKGQKARIKGVLQATVQIFNAITGMTHSDVNTNSPELSDEEPNQTVRPNMATENLNESDSFIRTSSPTENLEARSNHLTTGTIPKRPFIGQIHNTSMTNQNPSEQATIISMAVGQTNPHETVSNFPFGYNQDTEPASSESNNRQTNNHFDIFGRRSQGNASHLPPKPSNMFQFQSETSSKSQSTQPAFPKYQFGLGEAFKQTQVPRPSVTFPSQNNRNGKSSYFEHSKINSLEWDPNDIQDEYQSNFAKNLPKGNQLQDTLGVADKTVNDATKGHEESLLVKYRDQLNIALDIINKFSEMTGTKCPTNYPSLPGKKPIQSFQPFSQSPQGQKPTQNSGTGNLTIRNHRSTSPIFPYEDQERPTNPITPVNRTTERRGNTEACFHNQDQVHFPYPNVNLPGFGFIDNKDRRMPVNKWGFKFTGDNTGLHVLDFINTIDMYMNLEKTSKAEVLNSAYYLFDGPARVWYRTWYQTFHTFESLIERLKMTYLSADHDMILRREIENREQTQKESFAQFLTDIESKCQKLIKPLHADEKLFIIRRNLNTFYSTSIAAHNVQSIDHLIELCRLVDTYGKTARNSLYSQPQNMTNTPRQFTNNQKRSFNTNFRVNEIDEANEETTEEKKEEEETVNVLRTVTQPQRRRTIGCQTDSVKTSSSNLKFQHQQPNISQPLSPYIFMPSFNPGFFPFPPPTSTTIQATNSSPIPQQQQQQQTGQSDRQHCWNCHAPGHTYRNCPHPQMRIFCFKCGNPDVYSPNCPCGPGNAQ